MNSGPINQSIGGEVLPGVKTVTSHGSPTGKGLHGQRVQSKRESIWRLVGELDADFAANDTGVWDNLTGTGDDDEEVECIAGGPQYYTVDGRPPILEYGSVNVVYLRGHIEVTVSHLLSQDRFLVDVDNISTQDLAFFENDEGNIQTSNAADLQRVFSTFPQHAVSDNVIAAERNSECNTAGAPSPGYHWSPLHGEDASSLPMLPTPSETVDTSSDNTDKVNFTVAEAFKCLDFNTFFATLARYIAYSPCSNLNVSVIMLPPTFSLRIH